MIHFFLSLQDRAKLKKPIREAVCFLIAKGWSFIKVRPLDCHSIQMICLRKPFLKKLRRELTLDEKYASYEPEVHDLNKVEIKTDLLVCVVGMEMGGCWHGNWVLLAWKLVAVGMEAAVVQVGMAVRHKVACWHGS